MNAHRLYAIISPIFRKKRMRWLRETMVLSGNETLLDVGGTQEFWQSQNTTFKVMLLNRPGTVSVCATSHEKNISIIEGDGCALPFADQSFDVVFSNSVIEHVATWTRQQAFALEARRVGHRLWVQTPAREFFIEPHLLAPFIHWLPSTWQRRLIRNFTLRGWIDRPDTAAVDAFLAEVRLLTFSEMQMLFPDCTILRERFLGLTKSYIAVRTRP